MDSRRENHVASNSYIGAIVDDRTGADLDDINLTHRPRRHDDDDEGSDAGDDDVESTTSAQAAENPKSPGALEEEKELPPHACA